MKAHVQKHTVFAPYDKTVLAVNQSKRSIKANLPKHTVCARPKKLC